jgi:hypothetical protein
MSVFKKFTRAISRPFRQLEKYVFRPVYKNVVRPVFRPIEKSIIRPVYQDVIRPIAPAIKKIGPDIEKGIRGIAAVGLPVAAGILGGPLGAAAALQVSAQTPWLKKGWQDAMRETGNLTGVDWIKENPYKVAGIGSIALGGYGLANMAAGGGTGWAWGPQAAAPGAAGSGAGAGLGGTGTAPATAGKYAASTGGGITSTPTVAGVNAAKAAGINTGLNAGAPVLSASLPTSAGVTAGLNAGAPVLTAAIPKAAASGGLFSGIAAGGSAAVAGLKSAAPLLGLGALAYGLFNRPKVPNFADEVPDYPSLMMGGGGGAEGISTYDAMGGQYGDQWQQYMNELRSYADQQRDFYNQYANPVQKKYLEMVMNGIDPDIAAASAGAEVMQSYDATQQMMARQQAGMGINPSSPLYQAQAGDLAMSAALGQAQARAGARQNAAGMNAAMLGQGAQYAAGLGQNVAGMYGNLAGQAGNMAGMYTDAMGVNANVSIANARMATDMAMSMNEARVTYAGQVAQANINAAQTAYNSRLQFNYGLSQMGGQLFANWLFG